MRLPLIAILTVCVAATCLGPRMQVIVEPHPINMASITTVRGFND